MCDALKLIHEEDIAHRDLTPNNVLIWEIKKGRNNDVKRIRVVFLIFKFFKFIFRKSLTLDYQKKHQKMLKDNLKQH